MDWKTTSVLSLFVLGVIGVLAFSGSHYVSAATSDTNTTVSSQMTRACIFPAGGWTEVDCSAGAAYSAALTPWARYVLQAQVGSPYVAWGTAGSGQDADSSDGYLPLGAWVEMMTSETILYFSCDGSGDSSKIRYIECQ